MQKIKKIETAESLQKESKEHSFTVKKVIKKISYDI